MKKNKIKLRRLYNVDECTDIDKLRRSVKYYRLKLGWINKSLSEYRSACNETFNLKQENEKIRRQLNEANYVGSLWKKEYESVRDENKRLWDEKIKKVEKEIEATSAMILASKKESLDREPEHCKNCPKKDTNLCLYLELSNSVKNLCMEPTIRRTRDERKAHEHQYTFEEFTHIAFDSNTDQKLAEHYQFHLLDARKWAFVRKIPIEQARFYIDDRTGYCRVEVDDNNK